MFPVPVNLFFLAPPFEKSDVSGVIVPVQFFFPDREAFFTLNRSSKALDLIDAIKTFFGAMPQTIICLGEYRIEFAETGRVLAL